MAGVAQLVRASGCGSEGRGFEPRRLPQLAKLINQIKNGYYNIGISCLFYFL